ncbi:MAG: transcription elongation factor GreA [Alphaproteobacteria bacterium]|nr:transcription elongation factor GreA [Alphaproteobacteria bacterium]
MTDKVPMTKLGYERLEEELKKLKTVERPAIVKAIAEAREHGDLSENAEYHAARERQSFVEGRVQELESKISRADIIDVSHLTGKNIKFGASVVLIDDDSGEEVTYQIVGEDEADIKAGLLSITAPLARALINKTVGDTVEVTTPKGARGYEVKKVAYR